METRKVDAVPYKNQDGLLRWQPSYVVSNDETGEEYRHGLFLHFSPYGESKTWHRELDSGTPKLYRSKARAEKVAAKKIRYINRNWWEKV